MCQNKTVIVSGIPQGGSIHYAEINKKDLPKFKKRHREVKSYSEPEQF